MKATIFAPESYWNATAKQKDSICNGCGAKEGFIKAPKKIYGLDVSICCNIHDWMYHEGLTADDKVIADRVFLNNMTRIIKQNSKFRFVMFLRLTQAKTYFLAVNYFGGDAFWFSKNTNTTLKEIEL